MSQIVSILNYTQIRRGVPTFWVSKRLSEGSMTGRWQFPGGKVETTDADMVAAAVREFREETGLEIHGSRMLRLTSMNASHPTLGDYTINWFLLELARTEIPKRTEPDQATPWELVTGEELSLRECLPGTRRAMSAAFDYMTKGPFG